jgi:hypothetical protein
MPVLLLVPASRGSGRGRLEVMLLVRLAAGRSFALHGDVRDLELLRETLADLRQDRRLRVDGRIVHKVRGEADLAARINERSLAPAPWL